MPLTLGIDCALRQLNLSLSDDDRLYGDLCLRVDTRQSELLPPVTDEFLSSLRCRFSDLGLIAVTTGPGYYTGIRVGLSYATALAWSLGIKIAPIPTLYALAYGPLRTLRALGVSACAAPVIGAGRGSLYGAAYRLEGGRAESVVAPSFFADAGFAALLDSLDEGLRPVIVAPDYAPDGLLRKSRHRFLPQPGPMGESLALISREAAPVPPGEVRASYLREPG
jgi:tRNA threonylcarbamoyladenosine biosynthesis protein TsaB